jgi:hypothetical protein
MLKVVVSREVVVMVGFTTIYMQSVPITTKVVSLNPTHDRLYSIQHYVIKVFRYLRQIQYCKNEKCLSVLHEILANIVPIIILY